MHDCLCGKARFSIYSRLIYFHLTLLDNIFLFGAIFNGFTCSINVERLGVVHSSKFHRAHTTLNPRRFSPP
jgi:hypothetical protein